MSKSKLPTDMLSVAILKELLEATPVDYAIAVRINDEFFTPGSVTEWRFKDGIKALVLEVARPSERRMIPTEEEG